MGSEPNNGRGHHLLLSFCFLVTLFAALAPFPQIATSEETKKVVQIEYAVVNRVTPYGLFVDDNALKIFDPDDPLTPLIPTEAPVILQTTNPGIKKKVQYTLPPGTYLFEATVNGGQQVAKGYFVVDDRDGDLNTDGFNQQIILIRRKFSYNQPLNDPGLELHDLDGNVFTPFFVGYSNSDFVLVRHIGRVTTYKYSASVIDPRYTLDGTDEFSHASTYSDSLTTATLGTTSLKFFALISTLIKAPKGTDVRVYNKTGGYHYTPFTEYLPKEDPDYSNEGHDAFTFNLPIGATFHLEASGGGYLRTAEEIHFDSKVKAMESFTISLDLAEGDNHRRDYDLTNHGKGESAYDDDLYLNLDDSRALELQEGGTFELFPLRVWQAMEGEAGNYFNEPDYRFELIDLLSGETATLHSLTAEKGSEGTADNGSISLTPLGSRGRETYLLKGEKAGFNLIKITYDAVKWGPGGFSLGWDDNSLYHIPIDPSEYLYFNPIEERNTVVIPVNVAYEATPGNIQHNIGYSGEYDTIYIDSAVGYAEHTFTPTTKDTSPITSVRVHKPLHGYQGNWKDAWDDESEWTSGVEKDGSYTIKLLDGRNIVEIKAGDEVKYYVLYARAVEIKITNEGKPEWERGQPVALGDRLTIEWPGMSLKIPVQKLASIYNPGFSWAGGTVHTRYYERYAYDEDESDEREVKSDSVQYRVKTTKTEYTPLRAGSVTLSGGQIYCPWLGHPLNKHREIVAGNLKEDVTTDALEHTGQFFSRLPDISFEVVDPYAPTVAVRDQDGTPKSGSPGSAAFTVTTTNIADGEYDATLDADAPDGVTITPGKVTITGNSGKITLTTTADTPADDHQLKLTLTLGDDASVTSLPFTLVVGEDTGTGEDGAEPTMTVGAQVGTLTFGIGGNVSFPLTTTNIEDGDDYGVALTDAPKGVKLASGSVKIDGDGKGAVTLTTTADTPAGNHTIPLTLKKDGEDIATADLTLKVTTANAATVAVGSQSGTLTHGTGGNVSFPVTTVNVKDGTYTISLSGAAESVTAPSGNVQIAGSKGTLTLTTAAAKPAGTHQIRLTLKLDDVTSVTSQQFALTVNERKAEGTDDGAGYAVDKTTDPAKPAVIVPSETKSAKDTETGKTTTTTTVAKGSLTAATETAVNEAKDSESGESAITIPAKTAEAGDVKAAVVEILAEDLKAVAESGEKVGVKIESSVGEVELNNDAIKDLVSVTTGAETIKAAIERKDEAVTDETLTDDQKNAIANDARAVVYDVTLFADDKPLEGFATTTEGGKLTIGLPYTLKEGEVAAGVQVVYLPAKGERELMDTEYKKRLATFEVSHLSVYAVTYTPRNAGAEGEEGNLTGTTDSPAGGGCGAGASGIAALLALTLAAARRRKDW